MREPDDMAIKADERASPPSLGRRVPWIWSANKQPVHLQKPDPIQAARDADRARDVGQCANAAKLYRQAIDAGHTDPAIGIQLGNMLKESGALLEAEAAYRAALSASPESADGWLQLGHVLKLLGRKDAAADAYQASLRLGMVGNDAVRELVALGAGWRVTETSPDARTLLHDTIAAVRDLRHSLKVLEERIPLIESLSALPAARPEFFLSRHRIGMPIEPHRARMDVLLAAGDVLPARRVKALIALGTALRVAGAEHARVLLPEASRGWSDLAERYLPSQILSGTSASRNDGPDDDWVLVIDGAANLDPAALAWFGSVAARAEPEVEGLVGDEVTGSATNVPHLVLLPGWDPVGMASSGHVPAVMAVRRHVLRNVSETIMPALLAAAVQRRVLHLPRLLSERDLPLSLPASSGLAGNALGPLSIRPLSIRLIVTTREGGTLLDKCMAAAVGRAAAPERLRWTVVDNRPAGTVGQVIPYLDATTTTILRRPESFNWAAFNNAAAETAREEVLVFINDDVELLTPHWDLALASAFADPRVGAAGARLLYPDGRVQHAGVVLGMNSRGEHEGRGADRSDPGPMGRWRVRRRAAAVTGAFLACRSTTFRKLRGFDEVELPIWYNDIDFCLRLGAAGTELLFLGDVEALHHESFSLRQAFEPAWRDAQFAAALATVRRRWCVAFEEDPTYNPHFARVGVPFESLTEPSGAAIDRWIARQGRR